MHTFHFLRVGGKKRKVAPPKTFAGPTKELWWPHHRLLMAPPKISGAPTKDLWWPHQRPLVAPPKTFGGPTKDLWCPHQRWWPHQKPLMAPPKTFGGPPKTFGGPTKDLWWPHQKPLVAPPKTFGGPTKDLWWPRGRGKGGKRCQTASSFDIGASFSIKRYWHEANERKIFTWSRGVTVSTLDSESSDRGSNPRGTFVDH